MKQQGGIRPTLYLHNTLQLIGDSRVNLFRMEYIEKSENENDDKIDSVIHFWYVGCVHDLERPAGSLSDAFYQYAEEYLRQNAIDTPAEEQNTDLSSPFLTRSKAKALSEKNSKLDMDEVDEFIPDQMENESNGKASRKRRNTTNDEDVIASKKAK